jgi:mono/diheme cytochrome c family protein
MSLNINRKSGFVAASALVVAGGVILAWLWATGVAPVADSGNSTQVALGRSVYGGNCASCHGAKLEGQPNWRVRKPNGRLPAPPHDETGHTWHHTDDVLFGITKKGIAGFASPGYESDMPAYKDILTDEQIWAVLAFIKSRWSEEIQARHKARGAGNGG